MLATDSLIASSWSPEPTTTNTASGMLGEEQADGAGQVVEVLLAGQAADVADDEGVAAECLNCWRKARPSPLPKKSRSMPVGMTVIGVVTPRCTSRSAMLWLGAMTCVQRLQYSVGHLDRRRAGGLRSRAARSACTARTACGA